MESIRGGVGTDGKSSCDLGSTIVDPLLIKGSTIGSRTNPSGAIATTQFVYKQRPYAQPFFCRTIHEQCSQNIQNAQTTLQQRPCWKICEREMSIRCNPRDPKDAPKHIRRALPPNQKILELERERQVLYRNVKAKYGFINRAGVTQMGEDYAKLVGRLIVRG